MNRFICFDLEGPLSPQDNAYELMSLTLQGRQVFEALSRYDDLLTLEGREGYEPGDTLSLIVPFLIYYGVTESDITDMALRAKLVDGATELISLAHLRKWEVFCISTSYEQYAMGITRRLGIMPEHVASTLLPIQHWHKSSYSIGAVKHIEREILQLLECKRYEKDDDERLKSLLDHFFWTEIPSTPLGEAMREVVPVGGSRKVAALRKFASTSVTKKGQSATLHDFIVVGDSITDYKMLEAVNTAGGLAIAFNANEYALPYATMSLASTNLSDLEIILDAWEEGGIEAVEKVVKENEIIGGSGDRKHFHWLAGCSNLGELLETHHRIRYLVRENAAKLG